jgi:predicted ester cyclase
MSEDASPSTIARKWFEEWDSADDVAKSAMLHPTARGHHEGGMETVGPEEVLKFHKAFIQLMPDIQMRVEAVLGDETEAAVRWVATGTHTGSGMGLKPTGKRVTINGMSWLRVENGVIMEGWDSWNQGDFIACLAGLQK